MKRITWLFVAVLCSVTFVQAQSAGKAMELHGMICRSACVTQQNDLATCDTGCTDNTSAAVFVGDDGKVSQIAESSQPMCSSHIGKHVTMMAIPMIPTESQREQTLRIRDLRNDSGGS